MDAALGRLFDDLRAAGLYDNLTIAVTADHGESLLDHGLTTHGNWWEQVVQVPLIVKWRGSERAGSRDDGPSSALDVAPTLLIAAGVDPGDLPGVDLRTRPHDRPAVVGSGWKVIVVGPYKGITRTAERGPQLYDVVADPGETHDLIAERPEVGRMLARRLAAFETAMGRRLLREERAAGTKASLTDEERERLRALGYLAGGDGD